MSRMNGIDCHKVRSSVEWDVSEIEVKKEYKHTLQNRVLKIRPGCMWARGGMEEGGLVRIVHMLSCIQQS